MDPLTSRAAPVAGCTARGPRAHRCSRRPSRCLSSGLALSTRDLRFALIHLKCLFPIYLSDCACSRVLWEDPRCRHGPTRQDSLGASGPVFPPTADEGLCGLWAMEAMPQRELAPSTLSFLCAGHIQENVFLVTAHLQHLSDTRQCPFTNKERAGLRLRGPSQAAVFG